MYLCQKMFTRQLLPLGNFKTIVKSWLVGPRSHRDCSSGRVMPTGLAALLHTALSPFSRHCTMSGSHWEPPEVFTGDAGELTEVRQDSTDSWAPQRRKDRNRFKSRRTITAGVIVEKWKSDFLNSFWAVFIVVFNLYLFIYLHCIEL